MVVEEVGSVVDPPPLPSPAVVVLDSSPAALITLAAAAPAFPPTLDPEVDVEKVGPPRPWPFPPPEPLGSPGFLPFDFHWTVHLAVFFAATDKTS